MSFLFRSASFVSLLVISTSALSTDFLSVRDVTSAEMSLTDQLGEQRVAVASHDDTKFKDKKVFSDKILNLKEASIFLDIYVENGAPCEAWIDGPLSGEEDGTRCDWLITLDKCDPKELFGENVRATDAATCSPLFYIRHQKKGALTKVKSCPSDHYHLTGLYSVRYVTASLGREVYEAVALSSDSQALILAYDVWQQGMCKKP